MKIGQKAPDFSLKDQTGKSYSLKNLQGDFTVVYFYPKDDTPGCTLQAKGYTKNLAAFKKWGAVVVGISGGTDATKKSFCKKYGLKNLLLSDTTLSTAKKWGAYGEKTFMGKKFKGIYRNTYLLDKAGKIISIFENVNPEADPTKLLAAIELLSKKGTKTVALGKPMRKPAAKRTVTKKTVAKIKTSKARVAKLTPKATLKKALKTSTRTTTSAKRAPKRTTKRTATRK